MTGKPTPEEQGIDVAAQHWQRSGAGDGTIEVAVVTGAGPLGGDWGRAFAAFLADAKAGRFDLGPATTR